MQFAIKQMLSAEKRRGKKEHPKRRVQKHEVRDQGDGKADDPTCSDFLPS